MRLLQLQTFGRSPGGRPHAQQPGNSRRVLHVRGRCKTEVEAHVWHAQHVNRCRRRAPSAWCGLLKFSHVDRGGSLVPAIPIHKNAGWEGGGGGGVGACSAPAVRSNSARTGTGRAFARVCIRRRQDCGVDANNRGAHRPQLEDSCIGDAQHKGMVEVPGAVAANEGRKSGFDKVEEAVSRKRF